MSSSHIAKNLETYQKPGVVDYYESLEGLFPCEEMLFEKFIPIKSKVLDLGVGGGRTTMWLAERASSYLGVDFSQEMIDVCQRKFPEYAFRVMDASDLHGISDATFDVVVFSFNGLDYLYPNEKRDKCLSEMARVTKVGGVFIFSEHNARQILIRPLLALVSPAKRIWRFIRACFKTVQAIASRISTRTFWRGEGYRYDTVHGGLYTFTTTPQILDTELRKYGFRITEAVSGSWNTDASRWSSPWYYYVAVKEDIRSA
jgi:SAM-dependent methyltransferase